MCFPFCVSMILMSDSVFSFNAIFVLTPIWKRSLKQFISSEFNIPSFCFERDIDKKSNVHVELFMINFWTKLSDWVEMFVFDKYFKFKQLNSCAYRKRTNVILINQSIQRKYLLLKCVKVRYKSIKWMIFWSSFFFTFIWIVVILSISGITSSNYLILKFYELIDQSFRETDCFFSVCQNKSYQLLTHSKPETLALTQSSISLGTTVQLKCQSNSCT